MTAPFEAAWRRFDRAETHRKAAAEVWNAWLEDEPYGFSVTHEGKGQFVLRVFQDHPTPPEMAIFTGEWLYNLRCALDYAVYDAAICATGKNPPPGAGQLQMPIYFSEAQYRDNEYRLKPLADQHRTILESMQPYRHDDPDTSALGWLHKLARIDRHRSLHVMTAFAAEIAPLVDGIPDSCTVDFDFRERVITDYQAEIARFTVTPWQDEWEVQVNPQTGLDLEISADWAASPFWGRIAYNERLYILEGVVISIIAPLEYDCTGTSRKAKVLTESFRAECDSRRKPPDRSGTGPPSRDW